MPGMCSVPGCKGYKKARSRGVVFHSLPTRDPERCRKWLKAIQNPKFDENTPVSKYGNVRVCSQHFKADDYEPDIQAELMNTTPRKILKSNVIPTVFCGGLQEDLSSPLSAGDRSRAEISSAEATSTSSRSPPPAEPDERLCRVASEDRLNESFHQDTELSSTTDGSTEKPRESVKDLSQSKTIVNDSCLMELFKKCQTCGQTITKKKVSHCGAQKKVRWSCLGGHRGIWVSSPRLWEAFPEIHLLTTLAIVFSGGTFTYFKKWAKHLHLNFMGNKTFFEIQKAYLNPEKKQIIRTEQEVICAEGVHQQLEATPLHTSDPPKTIKAKPRGREKGGQSPWSSYEKRSSVSMTSPGTELTALSGLGHVSVYERRKHHLQDDVEHQSGSTHMVTEVDRLQDCFEEMEVAIDEDGYNSVAHRIVTVNVTEAPEVRAAGADDSCEEDVYVPLIPQSFRSTTSELLLECEEEDLEPWQKQTSQVHLKDEDDAGELTNDQIDCKPEPSSLQRNVANTSPPTVKTETPDPVVFNNQGFIVVSPQLTSNVEFISSVPAQCPPRSSFAVLPAGHQPLLQKLSTATVTPEAYVGVHSNEVQQISNNPVSLSSVQSPAVYATSTNQLQSDQSSSQTLSLSLPCFTVHELESTGTSNEQQL